MKEPPYVNPGRPGHERNDGRKLGEHVQAELVRLLSAPLPPALYLVSTPIGNLTDITVRALAVLTGADAIYCEDTRQSRKLLTRYGIDRPLQIYHEHNAERARPAIIEALGAGSSVALVSDAGTPLVSDPGFKLVRAAIEAGHRVISVPGASAMLAALTCGGLPTDSVFFAGFLPPKAGARREKIAALKSIRGTLVLYEAPSRLADTLSELSAQLGARQAAVARELTKLHEEVRRGTLAELRDWSSTAEIRGEITLLIGPPATEEASETEIIEHLQDALDTHSVRDAARIVAEELGVARSRVYDLAIQLRART